MSPANVEIMDRLRNETADAHRIAESNPLEQALFRGSLPTAGFVAYLQQRFCIHRVLDRSVETLVKSNARFDGLIPDCLWQTPHLLADLEYWNSKPSEIRPLPATATYCDWLEQRTQEVRCGLLGAYYVFEGSKNGSRMLARVLSLAYSIRDGRGLRFMDPHGSEQRTLWHDFRARMNAVGFSSAEKDEMVDAAKNTFAAIHEIDTEIWNSSQTAQACCGGACRA